MEGLVFVAFYLHYYFSCLDVDKAHSRVIGGNHGKVAVKEVDACHFAATRELTIIVFAFYLSFKL